MRMCEINFTASGDLSATGSRRELEGVSRDIV